MSVALPLSLSFLYEHKFAFLVAAAFSIRARAASSISMRSSPVFALFLPSNSKDQSLICVPNLYSQREFTCLLLGLLPNV